MAKFITLTDRDTGHKIVIPISSVNRIKYVHSTGTTWVILDNGGVRVEESFDQVKSLVKGAQSPKPREVTNE